MVSFSFRHDDDDDDDDVDDGDDTVCSDNVVLCWLLSELPLRYR